MRNEYENNYEDIPGSGHYWDGDVNQEIYCSSPWQIRGRSENDLPDGVDNVADRMHETVVEEMIARIVL